MSSHARFATIIGAVAVTALLLRPATAAPPAEQIVEQVKQAYQQTGQYHSAIELRMERTAGGETQSQTNDATVAYDREGGRLLFDGPMTRMVVSDGKLRLQLEGVSGHYLETDVSGPITYQVIDKNAPPVTRPLPLPDIAFLLSDKPIVMLTAIGSTDKDVEEIEHRADSLKSLDPAKEGEGPRLQMQIEVGTLTLTLDPKSKLISRATIDIDSDQGPSDAEITVYMNHNVKTGEKALEQDSKDEVAQDEAAKEELFAFDTSGREKVDSFQALMETLRGNGRNGGGGGHALEGKPAPGFKLNRLDGNRFATGKDATEVMIFDFWATWCPPCRKALPKLQQVHEWAQKEHGQKVSVYAINVRESEDKARSYWKDNGFTIPVLMDTDASVAGKYQVRGIPQTVVIHNGRVASVHVGYSSNMGDTLKKEINALLKDDSDGSDSEAKPQR